VSTSLSLFSETSLSSITADCPTTRPLKINWTAKVPSHQMAPNRHLRRKINHLNFKDKNHKRIKLSLTNNLSLYRLRQPKSSPNPRKPSLKVPNHRARRKVAGLQKSTSDSSKLWFCLAKSGEVSRSMLEHAPVHRLAVTHKNFLWNYSEETKNLKIT